MAFDTNSIFETIDDIAKRRIDSTSLDKTILGQIVSVKNLNIGEYRLSYQDNTFSVWSMDVEITYKVGEYVYVLVPGGDFSGKKIILGGANETPYSYEEKKALTNFFIDQSPNWFSDDWYNDIGDLQICAVEEKNHTLLGADANWKHYGFARWALYSQAGFDAVKTQIKNLVDTKILDDTTQVTDVKPKKTVAEYYKQNQDYRTQVNGDIDALVKSVHQLTTDTPQASNSKLPIHYLDEDELTQGDEHIQEFAKYATHLKISATFRTNFNTSHEDGRYILRVECLVKNPKYLANDDPDKITADKAIETEYTINTYDLSFDDFTGDPYSYVAGSYQVAYFPLPEEMLVGLYRVTLLQDGKMLPDYYYTVDDSGALIIDTSKGVGGYQLLENNIFCENINVCFAQQVNLTDTVYYPWIETPHGTNLYMTSSAHPKGRPSLNLVGHLQYQNQDVIDNCIVHWFVRDSSVTEADATAIYDNNKTKWTTYSGPGWMPIQLVKRNHSNWYDINGSELIINNDYANQDLAVIWKNVYRMVAVYGQGSSATYQKADVTIKNLDSEYDLEIKEIVGGIKEGSFYLQVVNNKADDAHKRPWYAQWYVMKSDGAYMRIGGITNEPLCVDEYTGYSFVTFRAIAYDPYLIDPDDDGANLITTNPIGDLEKVYQNASASDLMITWDAAVDAIYYTEKGIILNKDDSGEAKSYWLKPTVTMMGDFAGALHMKILGPDGNILPDFASETQGASFAKDIETSMMTNIYKDVDGTIHFTPRDEYDVSKADEQYNTFTAVLTLRDGTHAESKQAVRFLKQSGQGNSGFGWKVVIAPCQYFDDCPKDKGGTADVSEIYKKTVGADRPLQIEPFNWTVPTGTTNLVYQWDTTNPTDTSKWKLAPIKNRNCFRFKQKEANTGAKRLFLRPFVYKDGKLIENYPAEDGYYFKAYWDVQYPKVDISKTTIGKDSMSYRSNLRLYHAPKTGPGIGEIYNQIQMNGNDIYDYYNVGSKYNSQDYSARNKCINEGDAVESFNGLSANAKAGDEKREPTCGLKAFSSYPSFDPVGWDSENYGAVEVRYHSHLDEVNLVNGDTSTFTRGDTITADTTTGKQHYNFKTPILDYYAHVIVTVEIYQTSNLQGLQDVMINGFLKRVPKNYESWTSATKCQMGGSKIATITVNYPVDIFYDMNYLNGEKVVYDESKGHINWVREVIWQPSGDIPKSIELHTQCPTDEKNSLKFRYGSGATWVLNRSKEAYNHTPQYQTITTKYSAKEAGNYQIYQANSKYPFQSNATGVIMTRNPMPSEIIKDPDFYYAYYARNQVFTIDKWDNTAINGWDGKSIALNEEQGSIFAPMIGAGYKNTTDGAFSGVLMGVNESFPLSTAQQQKDTIYYITDQDENDENKYMTGVFGYQNGQSSFALLENGTAFFGKASGGGRIVIDGDNGTIYGGANGYLGSPEISDTLWNTLRINLVDLPHLVQVEQGKNGESYFKKIQYEYRSQHIKSKYEGQTAGYKGLTLEEIQFQDKKSFVVLKANKRQFNVGATYDIDDQVRVGNVKPGIDDSNFYGSKDTAKGATVPYWLERRLKANYKTIPTGQDKYWQIEHYVPGAENDDGQKGTGMPVWYGASWQDSYIKAAGELPWFIAESNNTNSLDAEKNLKTFHRFREVIAEHMNYQRELLRLLGKWVPGDDEDKAGRWTPFNIDYGNPRWEIAWQVVNKTSFYKDFSTKSDEPTDPIEKDTDGTIKASYKKSFDTLGKYCFPRYGIPCNYWDSQRIWTELWQNVPAKYGKYWDIVNRTNETDNDTHQVSVFGAQRASTTPAIEVGQHVHGLHTGSIPDEMFNTVMQELTIPGDRNFMVTYDGTMWAMNGVFMGNVIGSNIVGGKILGAEIHVGPITDPKDLPYYSTIDTTKNCEWMILHCPWAKRVPITVDGLQDSEIISSRAGIDGQTGLIWAQKLLVYGGSIDMGSFHIISEAKAAENSNYEYGQLIQYGESDLIGPTHCYGNLGVGPDVDNYIDAEGSAGRKQSNSGNIFQTNGVVALGMSLYPVGTPADKFYSHKFINGSHKLKGYAATDANYYSGIPATAGNPQIYAIPHAQACSIFCIDSRQNNKVLGHFWPLSFRQINKDAYCQTMDLFRSADTNVQNLTVNYVPYITKIKGMNFFRIHPMGVDMIRTYYTKQFINENQYAARPNQNNDSPSYTNYGYLGYSGMTGNAWLNGGKEEALGYQTFYGINFQIWSDGNTQIVGRGGIDLACCDQMRKGDFLNTSKTVSQADYWSKAHPMARIKMSQNFVSAHTKPKANGSYVAISSQNMNMITTLDWENSMGGRKSIGMNGTSSEEGMQWAFYGEGSLENVLSTTNYTNGFVQNPNLWEMQTGFNDGDFRKNGTWTWTHGARYAILGCDKSNSLGAGGYIGPGNGCAVSGLMLNFEYTPWTPGADLIPGKDSILWSEGGGVHITRVNANSPTAPEGLVRDELYIGQAEGIMAGIQQKFGVYNWQGGPGAAHPTDKPLLVITPTQAQWYNNTSRISATEWDILGKYKFRQGDWDFQNGAEKGTASKVSWIGDKHSVDGTTASWNGGVNKFTSTSVNLINNKHIFNSAQASLMDGKHIFNTSQASLMSGKHVFSDAEARLCSGIHRFLNNSFILQSGKMTGTPGNITFTWSAEQQIGIYARFA